MNEQEWVERWEKREVEFRKVVEKARAGYDEHMTEVDKRYRKIEKTLHEKQAVLLRIKEIPLIGKWIVKYGERDSR